MSDRRRILGPAGAKVPVLGVSSDPTAAPLPLPVETRSDGGVRRFFLKAGLTKNANGLAYLEVGDAIVEVSVFGPRPIRGLFVDKALFSVECKFLPYISQPQESVYNTPAQNVNGRPGLTAIEHKVSSFVETAFLPALLLEKYPKSTIDVFITVIAYNPHTLSLLNLMAWTVNCTSVAMIDAALEMRDVVSAGHVAVSGDTEEVDSAPETGCECVASYMAMQNNELVAFWMEGGEVAPAVLLRLMEACERMSGEVRRNINGFLLQAAE